MAISNIMYAADNGSMGETSDVDCSAYRQWAKETLQAKFPDAQVEVINDSTSHCFAISNLEDGVEADKEQEGAYDFMSRLWDKCPWNFL